MEPIPARLMCAQTQACPSRPAPTERERQRRDYILQAGRAIFIAHGRTRVTLKDFATATGITQTAIRNQIADLDHLFALTLHKYLDEILAAICAVPHHHADLFARRRRADYFRVTRGICDIPTPIHFLWMRDRFTLPDDQLEPLEQARRTLGFLLAGEDWETALLLLDSHHLDAPQIEAMLAASAGATQPEPGETAPEPLAMVKPPSLPRPSLPHPSLTETNPLPQTSLPDPATPLAWLSARPPPRPCANNAA